MLPALLLLAALGVSAGAQQKASEPIAPGTPTSPLAGAKGARLSAPRVAVEQTPDGCVRLSWDAVTGAYSYVLGRSEGTNGYQRVPDAPTGPATSYLDRKVEAGVRRSYTVTPVDGMGVAGYRAVTDNFVPTLSASGACTGVADVSALRASNVVARRTGAGFDVTWSEPPTRARRYEVRHLVDGSALESRAIDGSGRPTLAQFENATAGEHRFEVLAEDDRGNIGPAVSSNALVVGANGGSGAPGLGGGRSSMAGAELSFAVSETVSLRAGASSRAPGGTGAAQWSSLDPNVATVSADGTITGRGAGEARVVAVSGGAGGGVRVVVVRVVVSP